MKFFKSRKKIATEDVTRTLSAMGKTADETVADLRRKLDAAVVPELSASAKKAIASKCGDGTVVAKAADKKVTAVKLAGKADLKADAAAMSSSKPAPEAIPATGIAAAGTKVSASAVTEASVAAAAVNLASGSAIQLFPGFEDQPFEMGYDAIFMSKAHGLNTAEPMLVMRWKNGDAQWFPVPPMFNKDMLAKIHERDHDLDRLLLDYGYDAEQLGRPSAAAEPAPVATMTTAPAEKK